MLCSYSDWTDFWWKEFINDEETAQSVDHSSVKESDGLFRGLA
jgi:hypothetical protein